MLIRPLKICVCAALLILPGRTASAADFAAVASALKKQGFYVESLAKEGATDVLEVVFERSGKRAMVVIGQYADEREAKARFERLRSVAENPEGPSFQAGDGVYWISSPSHWAFCTTFGPVFLLINASGIPPEVAKQLAAEFEQLFAKQAPVGRPAK